MPAQPDPALSDHLQPIEAVIFDTDGVVTRTAAVHMAAWKRVFDDFLHSRGDERPFTDADYRNYVDGVSRYDGVQRFLESRDVHLPYGDPSDPPGNGTICAVANSKNAAFEATVAADGVQPYATTRRFIERLHTHGIRTAVISASRNCALVLAKANMDDLFEVRVDGIDQAELGFPGKPAPDVFIEAARRMGLAPHQCVVVEDAISGVTAGRAGGFGQVVGLDRSLNPAPLAEHADLVAPDAADLTVVPFGAGFRIGLQVPARTEVGDLPMATEDHDLERRLGDRRVALFCDYDGTLTPIVENPSDATIAPETLELLEALADKMPVAILSGRSLDDIRSMVRSDRLWFAGSHGFEICGPDGQRFDPDVGAAVADDLKAAFGELTAAVETVEGAWVERKPYSIAVHYRATPDGQLGALTQSVETIAGRRPDLRMLRGKKVFELRPALDWDKGAALRWLLGRWPQGDELVPLFIGDDTTDEDAFAAIRFDGVGILVADPADVGANDRISAALNRLSTPDMTRELLTFLLRNF